MRFGNKIYQNTVVAVGKTKNFPLNPKNTCPRYNCLIHYYNYVQPPLENGNLMPPHSKEILAHKFFENFAFLRCMAFGHTTSNSR